jgi:hypothetical protein
MFGWLKKSARAEQIKLIEQNKLACDYVRTEAINAHEAALANNSTLIGLMDDVFDQLVEASFFLRRNDELSESSLADQLENNKSLRRLYDEILAGKRAFANQFGTASEKLEPFDRKFTPNEGWKVFVEHFR